MPGVPERGGTGHGSAPLSHQYWRTVGEMVRSRQKKRGSRALSVSRGPCRLELGSLGRRSRTRALLGRGPRAPPPGTPAAAQDRPRRAAGFSPRAPAVERRDSPRRERPGWLNSSGSRARSSRGPRSPGPSRREARGCGRVGSRRRAHAAASSGPPAGLQKERPSLVGFAFLVCNPTRRPLPECPLLSGPTVWTLLDRSLSFPAELRAWTRGRRRREQSFPTPGAAPGRGPLAGLP